ncbi:MAG: hypothetical protein ACE5F3_09235, partial [Mariprofundaceae bacterium]
MSIHLSLEELEPSVLQAICGGGNRILHRIEQHFGVRVLGQPGQWHIEGEQAQAAAHILSRFADLAASGKLDDIDVEGLLRDDGHGSSSDLPDASQ